MNVRPLHDRIIVQRIEEGEQKIGGIIIPDTAKEKPQQGKVIAAGAGKSKDDGKRVPLDVKSGDTILFGKYSGQEIKLDGEEYLIMREDEVLTPDSSRFWPKDQYRPGGAQPSFDKQFVRDYLEAIRWNKQPPVPSLPDDVIAKTREKYVEAFRRLTGRELEA